MSMFSDSINEREEKSVSPFLSLEDDLLNPAKKFRILGIEVVKSTNPRFGAQAGESMFERKILAEGETFRYNFNDEEGNEKKYDSKGASIYIAFRNAEKEQNVISGSWVKITREGKGDATRYTVTKVE